MIESLIPSMKMDNTLLTTLTVSSMIDLSTLLNALNQTRLLKAKSLSSIKPLRVKKYGIAITFLIEERSEFKPFPFKGRVQKFL